MYPMSFQQYTRQQDHKEDEQFENYPTAATYLEDHYLDEYLLRPFTWKTTYYLEVARKCKANMANILVFRWCSSMDHLALGRPWL